MIIRPSTTITQYLILIAAFITLSNNACKFNSNPIQRTTQRCGNGVKEAAEECDDGNRNNGDGCSQACKLDEGYVCEGTHCHAAQCGDGIRAGEEACDDGNTEDNDGCSRRCEVESGYNCPVEGKKSVCVSSGCGNGIRIEGEACDDGNSVGGDGCSRTCDIEPGYTCKAPIGGKSACTSRCGDGIRVSTEACDDGNTENGDGCDAECHVEPGYYCNESPAEKSTCTTKCGDGVAVAKDEECDDGNTKDNDGCSHLCKLESGWDCSFVGGGRTECHRGCGDLTRIQTGGEECDDGNVEDGDGCSSLCKREPGYDCQPPFSPTEINEYPETIYLPVTYRGFDPWLLNSGNHQSTCIASSSSMLSPSLSQNYGIPIVNKPECREIEDDGQIIDSNPYQYIFTDKSKELNPEKRKTWIAHNFLKLTLNEDKTDYYVLYTKICGQQPNGVPAVDTSGPKAIYNENRDYLSAVIRVEFKFETGMLGREYAFGSNDDLMVYLDGQLKYSEPGSHHRIHHKIALFEKGEAVVNGSIHTLDIFYMNRAEHGRIELTIPKSIVNLPSICSKCGNGKIEWGEDCDGPVFKDDGKDNLCNGCRLPAQVLVQCPA